MTYGEAVSINAELDPMATSTERFIRLECKQDGSSKFYEVTILKDGDSFKVIASYGRIGKSPQFQTKQEGKYRNLIDDCFKKLVASKVRKGYHKVKENIAGSEVTIKSAKLVSNLSAAESKKEIKKEDDRFSDMDLD